MNSTQRLLAFDIQVNPTSSADRQDSHVHTRAEVYLPGIEWRGYDPSRGLAVLNGHVVVAAGFHPELASPVAGWYSGGSGSRMVASDTNAG